MYVPIPRLLPSTDTQQDKHRDVHAVSKLQRRSASGLGDASGLSGVSGLDGALGTVAGVLGLTGSPSSAQQGAAQAGPAPASAPNTCAGASPDELSDPTDKCCDEVSSTFLVPTSSNPALVMELLALGTCLIN